MGASVERSRQTALGPQVPIGKAGPSWNTQAFVHYTVLLSLSVPVMGGNGGEQTDRFSTRHRSKWAGVMVTYDLPLGFSVTAAQQLLLTNSWQPNFLLSRNPPKARLWFSRLQFYNRLIQIKGFLPSISFIHKDRNSHLTLYAYERFRVEGGFVRVF